MTVMGLNFIKKAEKVDRIKVEDLAKPEPEILPVQEEKPPAEDVECAVDISAEEWRFIQTREQLTEFGRQHLDIVRFAQYLAFKNYVQIAKQEYQTTPKRVLFDMRVIFCGIKNFKPGVKAYKNASRLGQSYYSDLFSDVPYTKYFNATDPISSILDNCRYCVLDCSNLAVCPYTFAAVVEHTAEFFNIDQFLIYKTILGDSYTDFYLPRSISLPDDIAKEISRCDAKASRAAYLLMQAKCFSTTSCSTDGIQYYYVPLCNKLDKTSVVTRIIKFWDTNVDTLGEIPVFNTDAIFKQKPNCMDCEFEQCPDRLAAYFTWLGHSVNKDPIDIAYYAANNNTVANLFPAEHDKFARVIDAIKDMSLLPESKNEVFQILRYIVNRKQNRFAPCLPMNIALHTTDEAQANAFFDEYFNALWFFDYFKNGREVQKKIISVATESIDGLVDLYEKAEKGTIIHVKQIELLEGVPNADILMPKLCRLFEEKKEIFSVISGEKDKLERFFEKYPKLYYRVLTHHLYMTEMSPSSVFKLIISKLEENFTLDSSIVERIGNYIAEEYESSEIKSNAYVEWLHDRIVFNHYNDTLDVSNAITLKDIPSAKPRRTEKEIFSEINALTGLSEVKSKLSDINSLIRYFMKVKRKDGNRPNMHMVFSGNAGTGKTTVARLTAEILFSIGYIKQNKLVICSGKDFLGEYLGQSQSKTAQKCEQAYDGVLFIDEAYQLNPYSSATYTDTYKLDAISELIQQMENNRDRLIVIFAGYEDEMRDFIKRANPGLESRIAYTIKFPDYSDAELLSIFKNIAKKEGLDLHAQAEIRVQNFIHNARSKGEGFGNARYARNLFEHSLMLHARNTHDCEVGDPRLLCLMEEDITE